jgi:pantoate--beta-alanine ligase
VTSVSTVTATSSVLTPTVPTATVPTAEVAVLDTVAGFAARLDQERRSGRTVGVVLTMGALHRGHASLVQRAAQECDVVAVTIFVNPTQFAEAADLTNYPRTLGADLHVAAAAGASVVFAPTVTEMYPGWPAPPATAVSVRGLSERWEGVFRPGHFDGVATVVVKLLSTAGRCRAYFGEKDFQQLAIVRRTVHDLSLPVEVVECSTVRELDGLAMSSRNMRLDSRQRDAAKVLNAALRAGAEALAAGGDRSAAESAMADVVAKEPLVHLDYAALVDAVDLEPADDPGDGRALRLLIAATVGPVRLIDNLDPRRPA